MNSNDKGKEWVDYIDGNPRPLKHQFNEIWYYRDLLFMFVKREFVAVYKQTILGPVWFIIQPILVTLIYVIVFSRFGGFKTSQVAPLPFFMCGVILWSYFADSFLKISTVFRDHANLYGKVYFPRIIVPLSIVCNNLVRLLIQLVLLFSILLFFSGKPNSISQLFNYRLLFLPVTLFFVTIAALGAGFVIASITIRYRDLIYVLNFGMQLLMFATPVIYALKEIPDAYVRYIQFNPLSAFFELFRFNLLGLSSPSIKLVFLSALGILSLFILGISLFHRAERTFMDTV